MQYYCNFHGLRCFKSPDDTNFFTYLPEYPDVQRNLDGRPMLTIVDNGTLGYLIFTATWAASERDLYALRGELASRNQEPDINRIRLSFAPIISPRCNALIGDGSGSFCVLGFSTTSSVPPYNAVFNLSLRGNDLEKAKAGLRGESGFLGIEYLAALQMPVSAKATFRSNSVELLPWMKSQSAFGRDLRKLLYSAIEYGLATVVIDSPDDQVGQIVVELYDRVLDQVERVLPQWFERYTDGNINVAITLNQHANEPIRAFADIGTLVAKDSGRTNSGGKYAAD